MINSNYQLLDCGDQRRLEQFGNVIIDRPAPQATFPKQLPQHRWNQAHGIFQREKGNTGWEFTGEPEESFIFIHCDLKMQLRFSPNGQLGIYPEQADNWQWIDSQIPQAREPLKILNGFAYTGASTFAAATKMPTDEAWEVCHLDSSKSSVNWARDNAAQMNLQEKKIRFIVEDMLKFMEREVKRGKSYQGIILDPPAFGRAAGGKTWKLKKDLPRLLSLSAALLSEYPQFFLLSCHDQEISKEELKDHLSRIPAIQRNRIELLDLTIPSAEGNDLPNGIAARWCRQPY